ncbi:hypothetical protein [Demequina rhizosphaerae]|uniref:hypothetical protein n=1 Tax=Demequina rhizosphaerae TaxID=1638985 RepID=UPI0007862AF3|nr:hypothetical protein [Demequina rhizosphaerae]
MDWFALLVGLPLVAAWMFRGVLVRALVARRRAARASRAPSPVMGSWVMSAFALAPGERPTDVWRASSSGTAAWATVTTDGNLAVGIEDGRNLVRVPVAGLGHEPVATASGAGDPGMVEMTIVPAQGPVAVLALERRAAEELRRRASRA